MSKKLVSWILSSLFVVVWLTVANAAPPLKIASGFIRIGQEGFGDSANSYSWGVSWFKGNLYVGTNRHHLHSMYEALSFMPGSPIDPSLIPPDLIPEPPPSTVWGSEDWAEAFRAEIWRYNKRQGWVRVHQAPVIGPFPGTPPFPLEAYVPQSYGYRALQEFNGYLYACGIGTWMPPIANNTILRSPSGDAGTWENVSGVIALTTNIRAITTWNGKIYVAASVPGGGAVVFASADPKNEGWTKVSLPGFGKLANSEIYDLAVFNNHLYASTVNLVTGFEVWKTNGTYAEPAENGYNWTPVIQNGFGDTWNQYGMSMTVFKNYLYLGTAVGIGMVMKIDEDTGQPKPVGTRAFELIRIDKTDKATLIVGNKEASDPIEGGPPVPRVPLSKMSAGFANPFNVYAWNMSVYNGWLYVGTFDLSTFIIAMLEYDPGSVAEILQQYAPSLPPQMANLIASGSLKLLKKTFAGGDLWKSWDGVNWLPVTLNGFNNPYNYGIREIVPIPSGRSTPALAIGTANPFTGKPEGGCEVWLQGMLPAY